MHELAIIESITDIILRKQEELGASRVVSVSIDAGEMRNLQPIWVQTYFDSCTRGTAAEHAIIRVNRIPLSFHCADCDADFGFKKHDHKHGETLLCPECQSDNYWIKTGNELAITSMEVA